MLLLDPYFFEAGNTFWLAEIDTLAMNEINRVKILYPRKIPLQDSIPRMNWSAISRIRTRKGGAELGR